MAIGTPFNLARLKNTSGVTALTHGAAAENTTSVCVVGCGHSSTVPTSADGFTKLGEALASGQNISIWTRPNVGGETTAQFETPTALSIVVHHLEVANLQAGPSAKDLEVVAPGASAVTSRTFANSTALAQADSIAIGGVFVNGNISGQAVTNGHTLALYGESTATENMTSFYKVLSATTAGGVDTTLSWVTSRYANGYMVVLKGKVANSGYDIYVKLNGVLVLVDLKIKQGGVLV